MSDLTWGIIIGAPCWILIGMVIMSVIQTARKWAKPAVDSRQELDDPFDGPVEPFDKRV